MYAIVGGIYSVLKSKAQVTTIEYGSSYTLLGPLNRASVRSRKFPDSPIASHSILTTFRRPSKSKRYLRKTAP